VIEKNTTLILPHGTQIVTLIESKVLNENRFHPQGTVGKINAAPSDATHSYLIEFLDGSLKKTERQKGIKRFINKNPIKKIK
jgi:hypothetical protein